MFGGDFIKAVLKQFCRLFDTSLDVLVQFSTGIIQLSLKEGQPARELRTGVFGASPLYVLIEEPF